MMDNFTRRLLAAQREANAKLKGKPMREPSGPYEREPYRFRAAPYHGWPL